MDEFQVRDQGVIHVLVEERGGVEGVQGDAVGEFYGVELGFFGEDGVDYGGEEGVGC